MAEKYSGKTLKANLDLPGAGDMGAWESWAKATGSWGPDYDYSKVGSYDERGHGSDRGKLPNHPTFSQQSAYAGEGNPGKWLKARDGHDYFEPSAEQVEQNGREFYKEYGERTGDDIYIEPAFMNEPGLIDVSGGIFGVGSKLGLGKFANLPKSSLKATNRKNEIPFLKKIREQNDAIRKASRRSQAKGNVANAAVGSAFFAPDMYELLSETR